MDQLPVEVWLRIFRYLHTIDILYSFSNLNNRLQQLLIVYQYDINLSNISFESCKRFVQRILPICGPHIRSLTLKNNYQIEFCMENKIFHSLSNLRCLKLRADYGNKTVLFFDFFSQHFVHLISLNKFELHNVIIYTNDISSFLPPSLTHIRLTNAEKNLTNIRIENLRNIKVLTIYLRTSNDLRFIESLQNLRELYVCLLDLDDSDYVRNCKFIIPNLLIKLHLEYRQTEESTYSSFKKLKVLLTQFTKSLQTLTLIIDSISNEYTDINQLQTLSNCCPHLNSFQYLIHTSYRPSQDFDYIRKLPNNTYLIYTMKPRRPISYFELFKDNNYEQQYSKKWLIQSLYFIRTLNSRNLIDLFPRGIMNINYRLPHLRYFTYDMFAQPESSIIDDNLVISLLSLATNLMSIQLNASTPEEILYFLKRMPTNRKSIHRFQCNCSKPLNSAFFFALSRYLPCLKYVHVNSGLKPLTNVINSIRRYFKNMILVEFSIKTYDQHTSEKTDEYTDLIVWLNEHAKDLFYVESLINDHDLETHLISIWL